MSSQTGIDGNGPANKPAVPGDSGSSPGQAAEIPPADENEPLDDLGERDRLIATALGRGLTHDKAGEVAGVSAKTVQRKLADPVFLSAVATERRRAFEQIYGALSRATGEATRTLVEVMRSERPTDRLRAAEAVLNIASRYHRQIVEHDLADRVERLEAVQAATEQPDAHRLTARSPS